MSHHFYIFSKAFILLGKRFQNSWSLPMAGQGTRTNKFFFLIPSLGIFNNSWSHVEIIVIFLAEYSFFFKTYFIFIYLAAPGLSCITKDHQSSLGQARSYTSSL